jgi:hypothetical protein
VNLEEVKLVEVKPVKLAKMIQWDLAVGIEEEAEESILEEEADGMGAFVLVLCMRKLSSNTFRYNILEYFRRLRAAYELRMYMCLDTTY